MPHTRVSDYGWLMGTLSRTPLLLGALVLGLGALVAATSNGLGSPGTPTSIEEPQGGERDEEAAERDAADDGDPPEAGDADEQDDDKLLPWLPPFDLVLTLVVAAVFTVALVTALRLRLLFLRRRPPPGVRRGATGGPVGAEEEETPADAVVGAVEHGLDLLDEGTPRNAIVAAWERLERAAVSARFAHRPADTPTEFVEHALSSYALDAEAIRTLAARYREARFSEHPVTEDHRAEARGCLETLLGQLRREVPS